VAAVAGGQAGHLLDEGAFGAAVRSGRGSNVRAGPTGDQPDSLHTGLDLIRAGVGRTRPELVRHPAWAAKSSPSVSNSSSAAVSSPTENSAPPPAAAPLAWQGDLRRTGERANDAKRPWRDPHGHGHSRQVSYLSEGGGSWFTSGGRRRTR
jgi:hypothetical protein